MQSHIVYTSAVRDGIQQCAARFGVVLPTLFLGLIVLACLYPDRTPFTPGRRDGIHELSGSHPIIGHTWKIIRAGTEDELHRYQEYSLQSPTRCYRASLLGLGSFIILNRPEYIEYVQKTNFYNFVKGSDMRDRLGDLLGRDGIFVADGEVWRSQRKLASHMFSANQFNNLVQQVVHQELNGIEALLHTVASDERFAVQTGLHSTVHMSATSELRGGSIDLPELFFRFTLSSFGKMAFGADIGCLSGDPACLLKPHPFAVAFDYAQDVINQRFNMPIWSLLERFSDKGARMRESVKTIRSFGKAIIDRRLAEAETGDASEKQAVGDVSSLSMLGSGGKDLLALFMEHTQDPEALLTVVLNFLIAGRDTTAQTLSWLFYELCAHPEHVVHIRHELDNVLGTDAAKKQEWVQYDDYKRLPYTLACVHEAARLHPPVAKNSKMVVKDDVVIPQGPNPYNLVPIKVQAGERIVWSDWVMNRLPEVWGEDAAEFNPQRFLRADDRRSWTYQQQSQWKFHVFNGGPRLCLGMNLAGYEAVSFVAATLQKYDFTWASTEQGQTSAWPPTYGSSLTLPMKDHYRCIVTRRTTM